MSMSSGKTSMEPKVDPLELLKSWERGDAAPLSEQDANPALSQAQMSKLWSLLTSPATPGHIRCPMPR